MRTSVNPGLATFAALLIAGILSACVSSDLPRTPKSARIQQCTSGEVWVCESRSASGISDGRHRTVNGRRRSCNCTPQSDIDALGKMSLPSDRF